MRTRCFDAFIEFLAPKESLPSKSLLVIGSRKFPASFCFYKELQEEKPEEQFAQVCALLPPSLELRWKSRFEVQGIDREEFLGKGIVLNPVSEKLKESKRKRDVEFLRHLLGDEKEMILALVGERGIKGLREREIGQFCPLGPILLQKMSQELEAEGKVKILSFSPLFLLSQESFDFLCQKILAFFFQFHKKHQQEIGIIRERINKRFDLNPKILSLALKYLVKTGALEEQNGLLRLAGFEWALTPEEEKILHQLEDICFKGEFRSVSLEEIQKQFKLSPQRLQKMISLLIERKRVIQGKERFYLHSSWLEDVIQKVKKSGKKELTVSDFKEMTGLTRKYAIPLLELLDRMGVTRRKGPVREIL
jgi:selenocysteine-specific elongation factor